MNATESEEWPDWAMFRISYAELEQLTYAEPTTVRLLNLVDLGRDCPVKMDMPIDFCIT
jgi:hypothetical protein